MFVLNVFKIDLVSIVVTHKNEHFIPYSQVRGSSKKKAWVALTVVLESDWLGEALWGSVMCLEVFIHVDRRAGGHTINTALRWETVCWRSAALLMTLRAWELNHVSAVWSTAVWVFLLNGLFVSLTKPVYEWDRF